MIAIYIIAGIIILYLGAELVVRTSSRIAVLSGIRPLTVGITIIAFGTSLPEAAGSIIAQATGDYGGLALGNAIGSNIANIGLILGAAAFFHSIPLSQQVVKKEMPIMLAVLGVLWLMMLGGTIDRHEGIILLLLLLAYLIYQIRVSKKDVTLSQEIRSDLLKDLNISKKTSIFIDAILLLVGFAVLIIGGYLLIHGAEMLLKQTALTERVIALTVVALGTSLPELVTTFVAVFRKQPDIAIGTILGSNIFNILFCLGAASIVRPITFSQNFLRHDMPILLAFTVIMWVLMIKKNFFPRGGGAFLLFGYVLYIVFIN